MNNSKTIRYKRGATTILFFGGLISVIFRLRLNLELWIFFFFSPKVVLNHSAPCIIDQKYISKFNQGLNIGHFSIQKDQQVHQQVDYNTKNWEYFGRFLSIKKKKERVLSVFAHIFSVLKDSSLSKIKPISNGSKIVNNEYFSIRVPHLWSQRPIFCVYSTSIFTIEHEGVKKIKFFD